MRRKSARNATKPQEKPKPPEQAARKSRRTSKRRRKSTSSETEKSEEEQEMQVAAGAEEPPRPDKEADASAEKAAPLPPPPPIERQKTRRGKVGNSVSEGDVKGDATKREDIKEDEGRTEKGKSKGKNKSKVEREPTDASGTFTESEICTNAQVTPQSPQTDINNAVTRESLVTQCAADKVVDNRVPEDNNENFVSVDDNDKGVDVVDSSTNENIKTNAVTNATEDDSRDEVIPEKSLDAVVETPAKPSDECDISNITESKIDEAVESPKVSESNQNDSSITSSTKETDETETKQIREVQEEQKTDIGEKEEENYKETETVKEESKLESESGGNIKTEKEIPPTETDRSAEDKTSAQSEKIVEVHKEITEETEVSQNIENNQEIQTEPRKLRRPEDPKWKVLERKMSIQKIKIVRKSTDTKEASCKKRWGGGLKLIPCDIIDSEVMKNIYPNIQFLQESDVKLDYAESKSRRFSTAESSDDRSDRRMSIDFDRQTSEDSARNDLEQEDKTNIIAVNRKISIIDDSATMLKPPPSPAKNPVSDVLFITNLVRPFTLKQLRELLERTGKIKEDGFWTDRIKSKCYVQYESEEEAKATREALHGVHWPIGNGKKLIIDYGTEEELLNAKNPPAPPPPPPVVEVSKSDKENEDLHRTKKEEQKSKEREEKETRRREHVREWDVGKEDPHRSKSKASHEHERRKHSRRSASPSDEYSARKKKKAEDQIPQKLMDDLFQKTKATPSIYWQPLTPEEIATKQQQRLERMAEHKKRLEETSRTRMEYGRGAPYRRKYD